MNNLTFLSNSSDTISKAQQAFRECLPAGNARETWIAETTLEYHRLSYLRQMGLNVSPAPASLLSMFLKFAPVPVISSQHQDTSELYRQEFGHVPPFAWTTSYEVLASRGGGAQPGQGGA